MWVPCRRTLLSAGLTCVRLPGFYWARAFEFQALGNLWEQDVGD